MRVPSAVAVFAAVSVAYDNDDDDHDEDYATAIADSNNPTQYHADVPALAALYLITRKQQNPFTNHSHSKNK